MKKLMVILLGVSLATFIVGGLKAQNKVDKTVTFEVNMHCTSCKAKIERDIAFEKGVKEVTASLDQKLVSVKYDEAKTTPEKISKAIEKLGYNVAIAPTENPKN